MNMKYILRKRGTLFEDEKKRKEKPEKRIIRFPGETLKGSTIDELNYEKYET